MNTDITKVLPGDTIKMKKPWEIASEDQEKKDHLNTKSLLLRFGPRCEFEVLQSTEDVITCRAFEVQNKILRAYITVDLDPKKMKWDDVEVVRRRTL